MAAALLMSGVAAFAQPQLRPDNIDEIIKAMTVEEKVDLLIGCGQGYTPDVKFPGTAGRSRDIPRLGITSAYMADGPHRLVMAEKRQWDHREYITTEFPGSALCAATFDVDAVKAIGAAIGTEVADYGLDILLAPGENLLRSPLCGRNHEYYSEDPLLSGKMAAAYINGVQSKGTGACLKHFAVNNQETNRNTMDARVSERALRELYLRNFEIAVKESQPWTIMTSYNKVNGKYTCEDRRLTETILRGDWGFKGLVMTDWNAGRNAVESIRSGNDMIQPGQAKQRAAILEAAKNGSLDMALLDLSVRRTLELVVKTHTYKNYRYPNETDLKGHAAITRRVGAEGIVLLQNNGNTLPLAKQRVALYGCTSYDLVPAGMGFGATGHGHYIVSLIEGLKNQGFAPDMMLAAQYSKHLADEQKRLFPNGQPPFSITCPPRAEEIIPSAEELAKHIGGNDVAIITFGRTSGEGADRNKKEFYLTEKEQQLIDAVSQAWHNAGKKVIVLLNVCSAVETASWRDKVDAVLCTFQPGEETGNSITDVLSGRVNPSGRLPMTWAMNYGDAAADANFPAEYVFDMQSFFKAFSNSDNMKDKAEANQKTEAPAPVKDVDYTNYEEGIYMGYRYFDTKDVKVAYPFGYGLSYTTFDYAIKDSKIDGDQCSITVEVKNTGNVAGRDVVQLYVSAPKSKLDKPKKELRAFAKTSNIAPGHSASVTLTWNVMDMASFDEKANAWSLDKGNYIWQVAASSADVKASVTQSIAKARKLAVTK